MRRHNVVMSESCRAPVVYGVQDPTLSARIIDSGPSVVRATRRKPEDMAVVMEDLIKWLDSASNGLRKGKYPPRAQAEKIALALRKVADDLDA